MNDQTKPQIELRKVQHSKALSEETPAYAAQIWVDGKHFCDVKNQGHGGCDMHYARPGCINFNINAEVAALDAQIKATYEPMDVSYMYGDGQKHFFDRDLQSLCHERLTDFESERELTRLLKRTIVFVDPSSKQARSYTGKHVGTDRAHLCTETLRKHPGAVILNNLPLPDALAAYKAATAAI